MNLFANRKQKPADPLAAMRAELQRITDNLIEEMRGQYGALKASADGSIAGLEKIRLSWLSTTKEIVAIEGRVSNLEERVRKIEEGQRRG